LKRPLDSLPSLKAAYHQALQDQLATRWFENPARVLKIGIRKASQLPLHCSQRDCEQPLLVVSGLEEALKLVGLRPTMGRLDTEVPLYLPAQAPLIDPGIHFAQFAAVWEPILPDYPIPVKLHNSLICEMGAGFHLLSLQFAPHIQSTKVDSSAMQLDRVVLHHGHETYQMDVSRDADPCREQVKWERLAEILTISRKFLRRLDHAYARAERTLTQGLSPIIDDLRREQAHQPAVSPPPAPDKTAPLGGVAGHKPEWL
jgi:hypothetical protein